MGQSLSKLLDDPEIRTAAETVYRHAEQSDGTVQWQDVRDELTATQWARLIQTEILIDANGRFVIDDPTAVEEALEETPFPEAATTETNGWSTADKLAGICALGLITGYQLTGVREFVGQSVNVVLGPLEALFPLYAVIAVAAVITGLFSTGIQARMTDRDQMSKQRERLQALQNRISAAKARNDETALAEFEDEQQSLVSDQIGMIGQMIRPAVWTMLVTIPIFLWLFWLLHSPATAINATGMVFPVLGQITWTARVLGPIQAWMVWYIICSIGSRLVIRKTREIANSTA
ncbi:DUF106 domain-containing protein [Halalkalicoccus tibetensis]|uniref:DUF106 domain-containing protein n=1 Tax=Halalkalicoccus tibetensis TaxID=175632 RepID=A0ABD5V6A5_9EURY